MKEATLLALMAQGGERADLDFKRSCNLNERRDLVELVKDIAAFAVGGGYIVVGADDLGEPTDDVALEHARLFDEATLRAKMERYVSGVPLRVQSFDIEGRHYALVCVLPHPDGWAVM